MRITPTLTGRGRRMAAIRPESSGPGLSGAAGSTSLVPTTHGPKITASSRNHSERRLIADNADVPLAGGYVFRSEHVTRSEVPSLTVRHGY